MFLISKETKKLNLIDGSNHAWKSVNNIIGFIFTEFSNIENQIRNNSLYGLYGIARSLNCTFKPKKKSRALFSSVDSPS